jgi:lipid-A-disaccharide synthase-like uncharacterized protein
VKWEPVAAMVALLLLGVWVVYAPATAHQLRPGALTTKFDLAGKGELEIVEDPPASGTFTFRLLYRDGFASPVITREEFIERYGQARYEHAVRNAGNKVFRALNITSWGSLAWVAIGFAGQGAFFGRMFLQWIVSERRRESVIPEMFWWLSLLGGVTLFTYFAWRQDIVGVLGQTSGVVIYARNIRLIHKRHRRAAREQEAATKGPEDQGIDGPGSPGIEAPRG